MLTADAVPAKVEMKPPGIITWPTNSGKRYVSFGRKSLFLTIKFSFPAIVDAVTKFTLTETEAALKLVAVNLSIIAVALDELYCVV